MHIFAVDESFRELGSPALGEPSNSVPAFVGTRVYVRGRKHLFCLGLANGDRPGG